ncbi:hypothetical protein GW915_03975 [bacterium]|nr:hypothetical protein [bacterium]
MNKKVFLGVFLLSFYCGEAKALLRTASFPWTLTQTHSAANWFAQNQVFRNEQGAERKRPMWILAGDSISASWSNSGDLGQRYESAFLDDLPIPNTIKDLLTHIPSSKLTWYSGSANHYGVFGFLDPDWAESKSKLFKKPSWVVLATAFAGATLMPELESKTPFAREVSRHGIGGMLDYDTVSLLKKLEQKNRAELLTFSLGGNDVCDGLNVANNEGAIRQKLREMKNLFDLKKVEIVPWKIPQVDEVYANLRLTLASLPERNRDEQTAKARVMNYCKASWEAYCPAVANPQVLREQIVLFNRIYKEEFGDVFDAGIAFEKRADSKEVFEKVSRDCFHPSKNMQATLTARLDRYLADRGFGR